MKKKKDKQSDINKEQTAPVTEFKATTLLLTCLQDMMAAREDFVSEPAGVEPVHRFRVAVRRLRSLLSFFKPVLDLQEYEAAQKQLRAMAQDFAFVRELDVLAEDWQVATMRYPELVDYNHSKLAEMLRIERAGAEAELYVQYGHSEAVVILAAVRTQLTAMLRDYFADQEPLLRGFARDRMDEWIKETNKGFKKVDYTDLDAVHALRIKCKKMRYAAGALNELLPNVYVTVEETARELQDILGAFCDARRSTDVLRSLGERHSGEELHYEIGLYTGLQIGRASRLMGGLTKEKKRHFSIAKK